MTHFNTPHFFPFINYKSMVQKTSRPLRPLLKLKVKQDLSWIHYRTVDSLNEDLLVLGTIYTMEKMF